MSKLEAVDYVDVIKNNSVVQRFWEVGEVTDDDVVETKIHLELGWGERGKPVNWEAEFDVSEGEILKVEPRFRGREVVSPVEGEAEDIGQESKIVERGEQSVKFTTTTFSNPNNSTNAGQGVCFACEDAAFGQIIADLNGKPERIPLARLIDGAYSGRLGEIDSPAYRFHARGVEKRMGERGAWLDESRRAAIFITCDFGRQTTNGPGPRRCSRRRERNVAGSRHRTVAPPRNSDQSQFVFRIIRISIQREWARIKRIFTESGPTTRAFATLCGESRYNWVSINGHINSG